MNIIRKWWNTHKPAPVRDNDGHYVRSPVYRNKAREMAQQIERPDLVERLS